ncbi:MAG: NYN domain-containing protein [Terracidiphilus sp.]
MPQRGKTIVYFDNSNIFHGQHEVGWRIDAGKLQAELEKRGEIWQVYFFAAVSDPPRYSQTAFYRRLKDVLHWETVIFPLGSKTVKCNKCGDVRRTPTEKGVDVAIATKMLTHAINRAFETAVLVSGDKDYLDTVRTIKNMGLRVEIVSFRRSLSQDLATESSARVIYLDDLRATIELPTPDREAERLVQPDE